MGLSDEISLYRLKVSNRRILDANPDLFASLEVRTQILEDLARSMMVELRGYVYAERLPPERVTRTTDVAFCETEMVPDGPWQRFLVRHKGAWWTRLWKRWRYPRYLAVVIKTSRRVSLTVELERYRTYPESKIGPSPHLGPTILSHTIKTDWSA